MFSPAETFRELSTRGTPPPVDGSHGYSASKWAAEQFLERVHARYGLRVWIHRPTGIVPSKETQDQSEILLTIMEFATKIKAVPATNLLRGVLDFVTVEHVSENIVADVLRNEPRRPGDGLRYVHQSGDVIIPIEAMKEYFEG